MKGDKRLSEDAGDVTEGVQGEGRGKSTKQKENESSAKQMEDQRVF